MERFLGRYEPYFYALLRIIMGFLLVWHGSQKLLGFPPPKQAMELNAPVAISGVIELVGGLMILLGLFAGIAAFLASGMLAVAYFMVHAPGGFFPILNGGELAVIYCFVCLYIAARGSGVFSIDSLLRRDRPETVERT
ncbi:MAG: DoxX family protein [Acidobacteriota bacterium]|nr:DoxX family protein [Acidobacteriota bacterium]